VKGWEDLDFIRLANAAGISVTYLREALTGRRVISLAGMKMIAKTLGFTLDQLAARIEKAQEFYKRRDGVRKFKSNERGMEER
jgi:transcriptional regulator with XRE-family HTH domain